jgi:sodium/hydrogen exchanger 8
MILAPWVSYIAAGSFKLSGIVSILTNGVFLSYYAKPNISLQSIKILKTVYEVVAYISETIVFLFLGIGCFAIDHPISEMGWGLPLWTFINLNIARAINIGVVGLIINCTREKKTRLNWKILTIMWYSGLRGAMAYALAL